jgi:hypothetical protein
MNETNGNEASGIETYRVGLLADLHAFGINRRFSGFRLAWRRLKRDIARGWRRRSYWNGFLAEWHYCPVGVKHSKCGRGWTRRAALRRLGAHIVASNLLPAPAITEGENRG